MTSLGRCGTCGRAFCITHRATGQGENNFYGYYTDWCTECQADRKRKNIEAAVAAKLVHEQQLAASATRRREAWAKILQIGFESFATDRNETEFVAPWERRSKRKPPKQTVCGRAVAIGQVRWESQIHGDPMNQMSHTSDLGLDRSGNLVYMGSRADFKPDPRNDRINEKDIDALIATKLEELLQRRRY